MRLITCVGSGMSLQVERVVETFAAERAQVSLDVAVAFHVSVQQTLQVESLGAQVTAELGPGLVADLGGRGSRRIRIGARSG